VAILGAIALPTWLAFVDTQRLNVAQSQVYFAFREAQSQAKKEKLTVQISFREYNAIAQWAIHDATISPSQAKWNNFDENIILDPETTLQYSNGVRRIQFDYLGAVREPPLGRITLSSKYGGKSKRCVFVSTILGALRTAKEHPLMKEGKYCY
jgi:type II secretory pathway pseudopilin PulG